MTKVIVETLIKHGVTPMAVAADTHSRARAHAHTRRWTETYRETGGKRAEARPSRLIV